ncbi:GNAT family N-acetyltransferase [Planococcus halotolerans]|uniref:GNAT family N-acetyltransferase n=1 Tax=Planococcus halotolerans TaxID=2233542 RepID=A0A365L8S0_9BACL|nr:GNAT family N-acetyltransferase [Planococcus halotolerans]RAZ81617.1 GNAT family N-acetyltransferase [Planococcus halotolerans]
MRKMSHEDLKLMSKWLNTKEVLEFFGDPDAPLSTIQIREKYGPRIDGAVAVEPYIAETEGKPFAFMQCYRLTDEDYKSYGYSIEETIYGIDQFIGEPALFSKGYGTQMLTEFLSFVFNEKGADAVTVDPELTNPRAIRCYEKCGFQKIKKINGERKWLMEITRER